MPYRPIINSKFSVTTGAEQYILKIIQPKVKQCTYSINSTMAFNAEFKKDHGL